MNENEFISIILPTYNRANLLPRCIESVLAQSYSNWELVISDDASTDDTSLISCKYAKMDSRIHYHRNPKRLGLPKNRNVAISISKGNLIFFVEDDLILERDCLEILVKTFKKLNSMSRNIGAVAPRLLTLNEDRFNKGPLSIGYNKVKRENRVCVFDKKTGMVYRNFGIDTEYIQEVADVHSCSLYPREVLQEIGGYEEKAYKGHYTYEEVDLNFRIRKKRYKLYFQPKALVYHSKANKGGVRISSPLLTNCYMVRNHIVFVLRNFGLKSFYMIPLYLFSLAYLLIKYYLQRILSKL